MYYVYALSSVRYKRIYVGLTKDLDKRLREHNSGIAKSTMHYRPWILLYSEKVDSLVVARKREKQVKSGFGKEFLRSLLVAPVAHKDRATVS